MLKEMLMAVAVSAVAVSAFAVDKAKVDRSIPLKDGSTVYIFKDGKMSMESKVGKAVSMKKGEVMETKDGKMIMMHGNEVMRLDSLLKDEYRGAN